MFIRNTRAKHFLPKRCHVSSSRALQDQLQVRSISFGRSEITLPKFKSLVQDDVLTKPSHFTFLFTFKLAQLDFYMCTVRALSNSKFNVPIVHQLSYSESFPFKGYKISTDFVFFKLYHCMVFRRCTCSCGLMLVCSV